MLNKILSPLGRLLTMTLVVLGAIGTVYTKGRLAGKDAEKERSRKVVKKVQGEMNKETQKTVTNKDTQKRLKDGTF